MAEVLCALAGAVGGIAVGTLIVFGTMYKLWPDLYAELRARVFEEDEDAPYDFLKKVKKIEEEHRGDVETMHDALDCAMEDLLISLGYEAGVNFIRTLERWYS